MTNRLTQVTELDTRALIAKLKTLGEKDMRNALRRSIMAGARVVRNDAKKRVPRDTDALYNALRVRGSVSKDRTLIAARVYVKRPSRAASTAHLVEFGTRPHSLRKGARLRRRSATADGGDGGGHPGARAQPFLRPALRENKDEILRAIEKSIRTTIRKAEQR
jgi:HK97 gp10 family phage protein